MATSTTVTYLNSSPYITTIARGTEYTLMRSSDQWYLATRRIALGPRHMGSGRYFKTLAEVAQGCKAFGDLANLIKLTYGLDVACAIGA